MLTPEEIEAIKNEFPRYEQKRGAGVEALKIVQRRRGWVSDESLAAVAEWVEMTPDELDGVATFYNHIFRKPVGRHVILLCSSVTCWVMGYENVYRFLQTRLGIDFGETSPDGRFTLLPHACLGCCDHAPAMMIDDDLHVDLDPETIDHILAGYEYIWNDR